MIRRAMIDDFVGIIFLIGAVRAAPRAMARAGMESSRVAKAHKLSLRRAGDEEECGKKREEVLVQDGVFHFILDSMDSERGRVSR